MYLYIFTFDLDHAQKVVLVLFLLFSKLLLKQFHNLVLNSQFQNLLVKNHFLLN